MKIISILLLFIIVYIPNSIQGLGEKEKVLSKVLKLLASNSKTNLENRDPYLTLATKDTKKILTTNETKPSPTGMMSFSQLYVNIFGCRIYLNKAQPKQKII